MNNGTDLQTRDPISIVRRRSGVAGAVGGAVFLASIFIAAVIPNQYEAWTTLLVSPQTISKKLVEPGVEGSDLNNRLHLMTMQILSRGRLSKVIDEFRLYPEESEEMTREEVIDEMRDDIRVEPVLPELEGNRRGNEPIEINTFRLYYQSHSPQTAADVAARLANDFIGEHIKERVEVSSSTAEFIEAELARLAREIEGVEQQIGNVKNENTGRLPEDLDTNQRLLERVVSDLRLAQRDNALAESDAAFYRQQAATGGSDRYRGSEPDTPAERKAQLEIALGEALARGLTEKHPDVIIMREELSTLGDTIASSAEDGGELSPDQALATNEAKRAELRAQSAAQEVGRLQAQADEIQDRIAKTPRVDEQLAALERVHKHLYESYQDFSNRRLEAGVSANMERRQKGEQFQILEAAFPPPEASSPNRPVIILLGFLLGIVAGAIAAILTELADTSFHEPRDVQTIFGLPVLATIPKVMLEMDRLRERRRKMLRGAFAAGVASAVMIGAGAGYLLVNGAPGFLRGDEPAAPAAAPARAPGQG
jgi:polysaccharide biosynthesis transport protein